MTTMHAQSRSIAKFSSVLVEAVQTGKQDKELSSLYSWCEVLSWPYSAKVQCSGEVLHALVRLAKKQGES